MNKQRATVFFLLVFSPLIVATCLSFPLIDSSFPLSVVILCVGGAVSAFWSLMWVDVIRKLYDNMDAYLFDNGLIEIQVLDEHFEDGRIVPKHLSFRDYFRLKLSGSVYLFSKKRKGDVYENRFYIGHCPIHNLYFLDLKHGWYEVLNCPKCSVEMGLPK